MLEELEGSSGVEGERAERDQQRPAEAEGRQPDERRTKTRRLKRKRKSQRDQAGRAAARPTQMSYAELDQHRREGHVNYHPGCAHCVAARALADRHERDLNPDQDPEGEAERVPTISMDFGFLGIETDEDYGVDPKAFPVLY